MPSRDARVGVAEALGFLVVGRVALLERDDGILGAWEARRESFRPRSPLLHPPNTLLPFASPGILHLGIFPTVLPLFSTLWLFFGITPCWGF